MPTLALSMIVKDAETSLAHCLESVRGVADEIVVADTGSADRTLEIAREFGARTISIPWENDFAKARNLSLDQVTSDWVLVMDADEVLDPDAGETVARHIAEPLVMGYTVTIRNYLQNLNAFLWDQPARSNTDQRPFVREYPAYVDHTNVRLFRHHPDVRFQGCVHESVGYKLLEVGMRIDDARFVIHHFGFFLDDEETQAKKSLFYRELGRAKVRDMPENALAHFELGIEESQHFRDHEAALPYFRQAAQLNPRFGPAWLFYAKTLEKLGRNREAVEVLDSAAETTVAPETVLDTRGDVLYGLGEFEMSRNCYAEAIERGYGKPDIISKLGFVEIRLGRFQAGLARIRQAISMDSTFPELHDRLISAYFWLGDEETAAAAAEAKLFHVTPTPGFYLRAASLRAHLGQWPRVLLLLHLGLDRFPKEEKLREALAEATRNSLASGTESRGDACFNQAEFDSACHAYQQAFEGGRSSRNLESKLGLSMLRTGRIEEGLALLHRTVDAEPQVAELHDRLIAACAWLGRFKEAADAAERRLNCVEPQPESYIRAAALRARANNLPGARAIIQQGLEHFPQQSNLVRVAIELEENSRGPEVKYNSSAGKL